MPDIIKGLLKKLAEKFGEAAKELIEESLAELKDIKPEHLYAWADKLEKLDENSTGFDDRAAKTLRLLGKVMEFLEKTP